MNELLKIEISEKQEQVISGRALHMFLDIETPYTMWFERMLQYGFCNGKDFLTFLLKSPYYCHNCGEPYPWTQARLETADKIVDMLDELDDVQKKQLKETFPDLIVESPKTQLSALVAAKIMEKVHGLGRYVLIQWFEQNVLPTILTLMNLSRE